VPEIKLAGYVVPKPRPRLGKGRVFTPRTAELAEEMIRKAWIEAGWGKLNGPLVVTITVWLPRPRAHFGTGRNADQVKPSAPSWPSVRPDLDNYAKTVLDALNDVAFEDDGQVVMAMFRKVYCHDGNVPGWLIGVFHLEGAFAVEVVAAVIQIEAKDDKWRVHASSTSMSNMR
jgi:Holliday junction resolvase RusA-like endonuclease